MNHINKYEDLKRYLETTAEIQLKVFEVLKERVLENTTLINSDYNWIFNNYFIEKNVVHTFSSQDGYSFEICFGVDLLYTVPLKIAV